MMIPALVVGPLLATLKGSTAGLARSWRRSVPELVVIRGAPGRGSARAAARFAV